jgi:ribosomal protein L37AE/L43A
MSEVVEFSELFDRLMEFHSQPPQRYPVVRTSLTEPREPIPKEIRVAVLMRDEFTCRLCWRYGGRMEIDHIIPWSAGGADTVDNLRTLCRECNETRSNRFSVFDIEEQAHHGDSCLRCDPRDRLDDMGVIWCENCKARGVGYGYESRSHDRQVSA